jgi:hypothetical protein
MSSGAVPALFQSFGLYAGAFTATDVSTHYSLYLYNNVSTVADDNSPSMTVTENSVDYYDNDWIVIQNT